MNTFPWFKCNAAEVLYGEQTARLSDSDLGILMKLRALCWLHEGLPLDEAFLKRALGRNRLPASVINFLSEWAEQSGRRFDPDILRQLNAKNSRLEKTQRRDDAPLEASLACDSSTSEDVNSLRSGNGINKSINGEEAIEATKKEIEKKKRKNENKPSEAGEEVQEREHDFSLERIRCWKKILQDFAPMMPTPDDLIVQQILELVPNKVPQEELTAALDRIKRGGVLDRMKSWALLKKLLPEELKRNKQAQSSCPTCRLSIDICRCRYNPYE